MKQQTSATSETNVKGRNIIDFTGKTVYVGVDVHQKDYQVAKVYDGICLGNHRMSGRSREVLSETKAENNHSPAPLLSLRELSYQSFA